MSVIGVYRRAVVRPLSEAALSALRDDRAAEPGQVEVLKIADDLFARHFEVFNDLDRLCGIGGDDHCCEEVEPERLENMVEMLKAYPKPGPRDRKLEGFVDHLRGMGYQAIKAGMPVFFVL